MSSVAKADGELTVLAVDAGRIAVRTEASVRLIPASGELLRKFPVKARSAALSGNRLAVRTAAAVAVYDTDTGQLLDRFPAANRVRLQASTATSLSPLRMGQSRFGGSAGAERPLSARAGQPLRSSSRLASSSPPTAA